jgi:hypothetical protein
MAEQGPHRVQQIRTGKLRIESRLLTHKLKWYVEGALISCEHFDEFTSPDPVSIHKRVQGAGLGSHSCHLRSKCGFSSFAVT